MYIFHRLSKVVVFAMWSSYFMYLGERLASCLSFYILFLFTDETRTDMTYPEQELTSVEYPDRSNPYILFLFFIVSRCVWHFFTAILSCYILYLASMLIIVFGNHLNQTYFFKWEIADIFFTTIFSLTFFGVSYSTKMRNRMTVTLGLMVAFTGIVSASKERYCTSQLYPNVDDTKL